MSDKTSVVELVLKLDNDEFSFNSFEEQDALAHIIDDETFIAPRYVGSSSSKRWGDIVITPSVSSLEGDLIAQIIAIVERETGENVINHKVRPGTTRAGQSLHDY